MPQYEAELPQRLVGRWLHDAARKFNPPFECLDDGSESFPANTEDAPSERFVGIQHAVTATGRV